MSETPQDFNQPLIRKNYNYVGTGDNFLRLLPMPNFKDRQALWYWYGEEVNGFSLGMKASIVSVKGLCLGKFYNTKLWEWVNTIYPKSEKNKDKRKAFSPQTLPIGKKAYFRAIKFDNEGGVLSSGIFSMPRSTFEKKLLGKIVSISKEKYNNANMFTSPENAIVINVKVAGEGLNKEYTCDIALRPDGDGYKAFERHTLTEEFLKEVNDYPSIEEEIKARYTSFGYNKVLELTKKHYEEIALKFFTDGKNKLEVFDSEWEDLKKVNESYFSSENAKEETEHPSVNPDSPSDEQTEEFPF